MKKNVIDHFAITVSDLEASSNWYKTSFECEEIYKDKKQIILQFNNIKLVLVLPSQERSHFAIEKSDANTYGSLREMPMGIQSCFISDPTGNPVELIQTEDE